ncbi:MAG: phenylalanine--tRNA ligase subunit beta, partial [Muribaculaceae bacterium]|nr:phenylalanine--tRNA ligase subunit beta [Muribaculaceae bacterium]
SYKTPTDLANELTNKMLDRLSAQGFREILNNSLTSTSYYPEQAEGSTYPLANCVRLLNPLSTDLGVMRQTLLFGGLEVISHNVNRRNGDLMLVELGNVYSLNPAAESTVEKPLAPYSEGSRIGLWLTGNVGAASWMAPAVESSVYHLRAYVGGMLAAIGLDDRKLQFVVAADCPDLFAAQLNIQTRSGKTLGHMGVLAADLLKKFDIDRPVYFAELDRDAIMKLVENHNVTFAPLPKSQSVRRDLALLLDSAVTFARVEETVARSERKLLQGVELFDVYEGKNLPEGKKSYAIAITLQDPERTLQDKQIDAVMTKIINNLRQQLGAELR